MTENQEKELFRTLERLVGGVQKIQRTLETHTDILDGHTEKLDGHTEKLDAHSRILDSHSEKLDSHSKILDSHSKILDSHSKKLDEHSEKFDQQSKILIEHTGMLGSLMSKTDSIARQVMDNDQRLSARITSVENAVGSLGGEIH